MYEVDMFPSRFFIIEDVVKHEELMKVLNTIKKDTENLAKVASGPQGPTYKTNFIQAEVHGELFKPFIEELNKYLVKDNISVQLTGPPWYAEYGEYDHHEAHIHDTSCPTVLTEPSTNYFNYSCIICLSDFGETTFINPNSSSFGSPFMKVRSEFNKVILFPSNIYHFVTPHGLKNKVRAIFSFNCLLKMTTK